MRNTAARWILGAAFTVAMAFGADGFVGTWKLNMEKSKFSPTPLVKSLTTTREAVDGGMKVTSTGERGDGAAITSSYTAKFDGKAVPWAGGPGDSISLKRVNDTTFTSVATKTGTKYKSIGRMVVSADGKTMTVQNHGTSDDGKAFHHTLVYDKQ